jgi:tRNA(Ile)-lysidine synthase
MINDIKKYIKQNIDPQIENKKIVVGLSGGPDSVFLLHVLSNYGPISLVAAHLNHGWRQESDHDEIFCKKLCAKLKIPYISKHAKDLKINVDYNGSKEEVGRKLRRHFFEKILQQENADYIALAHHAQDQQETFFLRLVRGCSLAGLTAIKPINQPYIRPLLTTQKKDILSYLNKSNIEFVIDHTNEQEQFLRNRIRKYILPQLEKVDPRFGQKFISSLKTLQEENEFLDKIAKKAYLDIFTNKTANIKIFCALPTILQKRLIIEWLCHENVPFSPSNRYLSEIIRFVSHERGGAHQVHKDWKIVKKNAKFWLEKP